MWGLRRGKTQIGERPLWGDVPAVVREEISVLGIGMGGAMMVEYGISCLGARFRRGRTTSTYALGRNPHALVWCGVVSSAEGGGWGGGVEQVRTTHDTRRSSWEGTYCTVCTVLYLHVLAKESVAVMGNLVVLR